MSTNARRIGKYELQQQLGYGGMAEVWKAYDVQLHRYVAIKILHANLQDDPNFVTRFEREAQLIASLHHPNIVQLHDFQIESQESSGTTAYMVMDYVDGETLGQYIEETSKQGNIPYPTEIVQIFTSIGLAVDYAHQQGMVHRDLKPANILLDKRNTTHVAAGEPILTDFGVAKLIGTSGNTLTGTHVSTPLYISPEQVNGYAGNERSDLYALGIILYEMVTGVLPFQGDDPTKVMAQHINAAPPPPRQINPNIPPALEAVILRSLAKDPAMRFPNALSLAAAIAEGLNVPIPEKIGKPTYPIEAVDMPTYIASPPSPGVVSSAQLGANVSTPALAQSTPLLPQSTSLPTNMMASTSTPFVPPTTTPPVQAPSAVLTAPPKRTRRWLLPVILALLVLLIAGSLGAYFLLPRSGTPHLYVGTNPIVGQAFFVSSGQLNDGAQGIADKLQVDIQNVQLPQSGKSYYLWLLGDKDLMTQQPDLLVPPSVHPPLLLTNSLPVQNNSIQYTYPGDAQHNNLLAEVSRMLITQEDAGKTPASPSSDPATWVYYAQLPQVIIPGSLHLRGLDHIRHLYYNEDHLKVYALYGGLDVWVFRDTEKILEWSTCVRDDFNGTTGPYEEMHNLFINILDYLDGTENVHVDVPPGTPVNADAKIASVSLLTVDSSKQGVAKYLDTDPPGDLDHLALHLSELIKSPDGSPRIRQLAQSILLAVANAQMWLKQVRMDAKALFNMSPEQLAQPAAQSLLEDLVAQATYAYIGQLNPTTNVVTPGVLQAHYDVQKLATFDITKNVPKSL